MSKTVEEYVKEAEGKALKLDLLITDTVNSIIDLKEFMKDEVFKNVSKHEYYELARKSGILRKANDSIIKLGELI